MQMKLAFGKSGLDVNLPEGFRYRVLETRSALRIEDPVAAIEAALDHPIGSPPLKEIATQKKSAAIASPNAIATRRSTNAALLSYARGRRRSLPASLQPSK